MLSYGATYIARTAIVLSRIVRIGGNLSHPTLKKLYNDLVRLFDTFSWQCLVSGFVPT